MKEAICGTKENPPNGHVASLEPWQTTLERVVRDVVIHVVTVVSARQQTKLLQPLLLAMKHPAHLKV